jgi:predicted P-loop ATPase/GTPase
VFLARVIVVSGFIPQDSGKTWFTLGLTGALRDLGSSFAVYKPVAAHNLWFSPRTLVKSFELRVLVGNDVLAYYERGVVSNIAKSNPVALALAPRSLYSSSSVAEYLESYEDFTKTLVLARITDCAESTTRHLVIRENLEKTPPRMRSVVEELAKTLSSAESTANEVLDYLRSEELTENLEKCLEEISRGVDVVVVESFNDAVVPYTSLLSRVDGLIIVAPGHVLLYTSREAIRSHVSESIRLLGDEGYRSRYLVERAKPARVFNTPLQVEPSTSEVHYEVAKTTVSSSTT